jgi:hypothetical protein
MSIEGLSLPGSQGGGRVFPEDIAKLHGLVTTVLIQHSHRVKFKTFC